MTKMDPEILKGKLQELRSKLNLTLSDLQLLLAQERFMARLGSLKEGKNFIWKGGSLVLRLYSSLPAPRFTRDLDLMLRSFDLDSVATLLKKSAKVDLSDGFSFGRISTTEMVRDLPYGGYQFKIQWSLFNKARSDDLKVDVSTGDYVKPESVSSQKIFLLSDIEPNLSFLVYPPEYVFAEKLHAVVDFGTGNTRVRDYLDLWSLIDGGLDKNSASDATIKCFKTRGLPFDKDKLRSVLSDDDFLETLEAARLKRFSKLDVPTMQEIAKLILEFTAS